MVGGGVSAGLCVLRLRWAGVMHLKKKGASAACYLSLVHAAICMYITDAETHTVEGFLNSHTTLSLFFFSSLRLGCVSFQPPGYLCRISFV